MHLRNYVMLSCYQNASILYPLLTFNLQVVHIAWGSRYHWAGFFLRSSHLSDSEDSDSLL